MTYSRQVKKNYFPKVHLVVISLEQDEIWSKILVVVKKECLMKFDTKTPPCSENT